MRKSKSFEGKNEEQTRNKENQDVDGRSELQPFIDFGIQRYNWYNTVFYFCFILIPSLFLLVARSKKRAGDELEKERIDKFLVSLTLSRYFETQNDTPTIMSMTSYLFLM